MDFFVWILILLFLQNTIDITNNNNNNNNNKSNKNNNNNARQGLMHAEGLYDDKYCSTDEGVLIRIKLKLLLLLLL